MRFENKTTVSQQAMAVRIIFTGVRMVFLEIALFWSEGQELPSQNDNVAEIADRPEDTHKNGNIGMYGAVELVDVDEDVVDDADIRELEEYRLTGTYIHCPEEFFSLRGGSIRRVHEWAIRLCSSVYRSVNGRQ